jgi:hypothetical protein
VIRHPVVDTTKIYLTILMTEEEFCEDRAEIFDHCRYSIGLIDFNLTEKHIIQLT